MRSGSVLFPTVYFVFEARRLEYVGSHLQSIKFMLVAEHEDQRGTHGPFGAMRINTYIFINLKHTKLSKP